MADFLTVANAKKIIDVGMAIKEAVETARRNEKECRSIERVVGRVCGLVHTLSVSQAPMLQHPIVEGILDDIWESLNEALILVGDCGKKHSLFKFVTAKSIAKKISRVQKDILQKVALGTLAITTVSALALSGPQVSRHLQTISFPNFNSRSEVRRQLKDAYARWQQNFFMSVFVNDQSRMTVAFAMRAAGAEILIEENNELHGVGVIYDKEVVTELIKPLGEQAILLRRGSILRLDYGSQEPYFGYFDCDDQVLVQRFFGGNYKPRREPSGAALSPLLPAPHLSAVTTDDATDDDSLLQQEDVTTTEDIPRHDDTDDSEPVAGASRIEELDKPK